MFLTKKSISLISLVLSLFFLFSFSFLSVQAGLEKKTVIDDAIDSSELDERNWEYLKKENSKISVYAADGALSINATSVDLMNGVVYAAPIELGENESLCVEFDIVSMTGNNLFCVRPGIQDPTSAAELNYTYIKGFVYDSSGSTSIVKPANSVGKINLWNGTDYNSLDSAENPALFFENEGRVRQIYNQTANNGETAIEYVNVKKNGEEYNYDAVEGGYAGQVKHENLSGIEVKDGYVGFFTIGNADPNVSAQIDNVKISILDKTSKETKKVIVEDDFENGFNTEKWIACGSLNGETACSSSQSSILFDDTDKTDILYSTDKLQFDANNTDMLMTLKESVSLQNVQNANIGNIFGLAAKDGNLENGVFVGIADSNGEKKLQVKKGTQVLGETVLSDISNGKFYDFAITLTRKPEDNNYKKAELVVAFDATELKVGIEDYTIFEGECAVGNFADAPAEFYLDNVYFHKYNYIGMPGANLTNDFSQPLDESIWKMQANGSVKLPTDYCPEGEELNVGGGLRVEDGMLVFDRTSDGAVFGPRRSYADFELQFDLIEYKNTGTSQDGKYTPESMWFGVVIGKDSIVSSWMSSGNTKIMFGHSTNPDNKNEKGTFMQTVNDATGGVLKAVNIVASDKINEGENSKINFCGSNYEGGPVTIKILAQNRTLSIYYKVNGYHNDFVKIAEYFNVHTNGYVSFCSTNWGSFKIDNYSIKNLDKDYDPANYPMLKMEGETQKSFDKNSPVDVEFGIVKNNYNLRLQGNDITSEDYTIDAQNGKIIIKKEFLQTLEEGIQVFNVVNEFEETVNFSVVVSGEIADKPEPSKTGCSGSVYSSVTIVSGLLLILSASVFIMKKRNY